MAKRFQQMSEILKEIFLNPDKESINSLDTDIT